MIRNRSLGRVARAALPATLASLTLLPAAQAQLEVVKAPVSSTYLSSVPDGTNVTWCPGSIGMPPNEVPIPLEWEVRICNSTDTDATVSYTDDVADGLEGTRFTLQCPPTLLPPGVGAADVSCASPGASDLQVRNILVPACECAHLRFAVTADTDMFSSYICNGGIVNDGSTDYPTNHPIDDQLPDPVDPPSIDTDSCVLVQNAFCNIDIVRNIKLTQTIEDVNLGPLLPGDDLLIRSFLDTRYITEFPDFEVGSYVENEATGLAPLPPQIEFVDWTPTGKPLEPEGDYIYNLATRELSIEPNPMILLATGDLVDIQEWEGRVTCDILPGETVCLQARLELNGGGFTLGDDPETLDSYLEGPCITNVQPVFENLTKTVTDGPDANTTAQPGEQLTFTIDFDNTLVCPPEMMSCQCDGTDIEIRDLIDLTRLESINVIGGNLVADEAQWDLETLPAGSSGSVQFTANVRRDVVDGEEICNSATITSAAYKSIGDGGLLGGGCRTTPPLDIVLDPCIQIEIPPDPLLAVSKSVTDPALPPYAIGTTLTYAINVENIGQGDADGVSVWDCIDTTCFEEISIVPMNGGVVNGGADPGCGGGPWIRWDLGTVPNGPPTILTYTVDIAPGLTDGQLCMNTATADSSTAASASGSFPIDICAPTLSFEKTLPPNPLEYPAGGVIEWTLNITNSGNCDATNVVVTDVLDTANLAEPPTIDGPGVYDDPSDTITWTFPTVAASGTETVRVSSTIIGNPPGTVCNLATMAWNESLTTLDSSAAPGTCADFVEGGCAAPPPAVGVILGTAAKPDDVMFEWPVLPEALDGYNMCYLSGAAMKVEIPNTCAGMGAAVAGCDPTSMTDCLHVGALNGPDSEVFFYQVKGLCGAFEGP